MKKLRIGFAVFAALVMLPIVVLAFQTQRSQIGITIIINVTPNPLAMGLPRAGTGTIVATARLRGAPKALEQRFEAQQLHFMPTQNMIAQTVQKSVKVEASIAPNPTATLLYSDQNSVILNAEAGMATVFPCAYHVYVHTTITSWTLYHGLSNDFSGSTGSFKGSYLANNSYVATPKPTATPFVVYATDGGTWTTLALGSGIQTYCVDLTLNMPIATSQGTYSSNAIYTLYY